MSSDALAVRRRERRERANQIRHVPAVEDRADEQHATRRIRRRAGRRRRRPAA